MEPAIQKTFSDAFFLIGLLSLVLGLLPIVTKTGFFFLPFQGFKQYILILTGKKISSESLHVQYEQFRKSTQRKKIPVLTFIVAFTALGLSLAFALVQF